MMITITFIYFWISPTANEKIDVAYKVKVKYIFVGVYHLGDLKYII